MTNLSTLATKCTLLLWLSTLSFAFAQSDTTATNQQSDETEAPPVAAAAEETNNEASAPTQAPSQDLFSVDRDQVGMFQNSVNLFTGEVAFSLPLASLPGRGGLNAGVAISYNSAGVRQQTEQWNLGGGTGVAGLGWQLLIPHIVVDNKQTGTRTDDDFYLVEGGISNPLVQTTTDNNGIPEADIPDGEPVKVYQSVNYKFWNIYYVPAQEKWIIIREDGSTLVYGDQASERNTVQYVVRWNNWIGNSSQINQQSQQAMRWELSEVRDIFDNTITYTYEQVLQQVGPGGKEHTEASYLTKITNPQGQSVTLVYEEKAASEYQEPHTEQAEPDAYQERYERRALDKLEIRDESNALRYTLNMEYQTLGTGNFTKRLLTSVQKTGENGTKLPPLLFDYERQGETKGVLNQVTTSQGGQVSYTRTAVTVENAQRDLMITPEVEPTNTEPGYAEPQTWIGSDYVVVAWRQRAFGGEVHTSAPRKVRLYVYQWVGRWVKQFVTMMSDVRLENGRYADFEVVTGPDFAAVKHDDNLYLLHKDENRPGVWFDDRFSFAKDDQPSRLVAGENFVVVGGQFLGEGETTAWRWDGDEWDEQTFSLPEGDYAYTAANNYFIAHNNDPNPDRIYIHYLDEQEIWRTKEASTANRFTSGDGDGSTQSNWYGTNSFAVVLADDNEEFIYQWEEDYSLKMKAGILGAWPDDFPAYLTGNSMIGLAKKDGTFRVFRYNGTSWISPNLLVKGISESSFGQDFSIVRYSENPIKIGYILYYDANRSLWLERALGGFESFAAVSAGNNIAVDNGRVYYRGTDGTWSLIYSVPSVTGGWQKDDYQFGSDNLIAIYSLDTKQTYVIQERNGDVSVIATLDGESISQEGEAVKATPLVGSDIVINFPSLNDGSAVMQNMIRLTLHKVVDNQLTGPQTAYPVQTMTVNSGTSTQYISYDYTAASATMSANGSVAQFNQVRTVPGVSNPSEHPYGYTVQYFFNGLSGNASDLYFPAVGFQRTALTHYGRLLGLPYVTQTYSSTDALVAESKSYWQIYERDLSRITRPLARAYYAQVIRREDTRDGVSQQINYDYGDDETYSGQTSVFRNGQLRSMTTTDSEGRERTTQYFYAFSNEAYSSYGSDLLREANLLSYPVIQTVAVNGTVTQKSETYYAALSNEASSIVPTKTVAYPRGNDNSITVNYRYDDYGNLLESARVGGITTATLWGYQHSRPVAQAVGTTYSALASQVSPSEIQNLTEDELQDQLSDLRSLSDAQVSTYTYDRLYGMTSETDPNGRSSTYEYDDLGRMYLAKNQEGNITGKFEYGYYASTAIPEPEPEPEPEPCTTAPTATISGADRVSIGFEATYTAQASGCASVTSFNWDATRGQVVSTSGNSATILWNTCGQDDVLLTITDSNGRSRTVSKTIEVDDPDGDDCGGRDPRGPVAPQQLPVPTDTAIVNP